MTTAAVALMHGDLGAAVAANPAILALAALTVGVLPLAALRLAGVLRAPRPWPGVRRRRMGWLAGLLAAASWLYQIHRLSLG